jgi:hypothetical protein
VGEDKVKIRREYKAFWDRLAHYSLPRREGLRVQGDIFRQRAAAFVSWVKMRLFGSPGPERAMRRQSGLLHRISAYHLFQRRRVHQSSETQDDNGRRDEPGASKWGLDRMRGRAGR